VLFRDNGRGIDPQVLEKGRDGHWGLAGMRERATKIGGQLKILTSPTAGTEVQLSIPGRIAFRALTRSSRLGITSAQPPKKKTCGSAATTASNRKRRG